MLNEIELPLPRTHFCIESFQLFQKPLHSTTCESKWTIFIRRIITHLDFSQARQLCTQFFTRSATIKLVGMF